MKFHVAWAAFIEAESPQHAAVTAMQLFRAKELEHTTFEVRTFGTANPEVAQVTVHVKGDDAVDVSKVWYPGKDVN